MKGTTLMTVTLATGFQPRSFKEYLKIQTIEWGTLGVVGLDMEASMRKNQLK